MSAISVRSVTFPFRLSSSSSWSTVVITLPPLASTFVAIPAIPDVQGRLYSRAGSNGGLCCAAMRFSMLGIRSLSSFWTNSCLTRRPGKRELSVLTMMSRSIPRPWESGGRILA